MNIHEPSLSDRGQFFNAQILVDAMMPISSSANRDSIALMRSYISFFLYARAGLRPFRVTPWHVPSSRRMLRASLFLEHKNHDVYARPTLRYVYIQLVKTYTGDIYFIYLVLHSSSISTQVSAQSCTSARVKTPLCSWRDRCCKGSNRSYNIHVTYMYI